MAGRDKPAQYAEAFLAAGADKDAKGLKSLVSAFLSVVNRRKDTALLPSIIREIEARAAARRAEECIAVEVAEDTDRKMFRDEIAGAAAAIGGSKTDMTVRVRPSLIGGFRVSYRGIVYDASHQKFLIDLYRNLIS